MEQVSLSYNQEMKIGLPKEVMTGEDRVALIPDACQRLVEAGHEVLVQSTAGDVSGYSDGTYREAGAVIVESAEQLYASAELIVKVKQPLESDLRYLKAHHTLFSFLHLAAYPQLVKELCELGLTAIPFESVRDDQGRLPLLTPMSAVAGRISVIRGASLLFTNRGGRGLLLGGLEGIELGNVVILGAGIAGSHATGAAVALGAKVHVFDLDESRLSTLKEQYPNIDTHLSTPESVAQICIDADLVVGAVLISGRRAPVVLTDDIVSRMKPGSVIVDIAIDQGGCVEGIRETDSEELFYKRHGVLLSAVPNMPAAVPRTSSQALSSCILPYVERIASGALMQDADLLSAIAVRANEIVDDVLKEEIKRNH